MLRTKALRVDDEDDPMNAVVVVGPATRKRSADWNFMVAFCGFAVWRTCLKYCARGCLLCNKSKQSLLSALACYGYSVNDDDKDREEKGSCLSMSTTKQAHSAAKILRKGAVTVMMMMVAFVSSVVVVLLKKKLGLSSSSIGQIRFHRRQQ